MPPKKHAPDPEAAAREESFKAFSLWWRDTNELWTEVPETYIRAYVLPMLGESGTPLSTKEEGEKIDG